MTEPPSEPQQSKKILLLSANPPLTNRWRVDEEMREIKEGLRRAKKRHRFVIESAEAVKYRDLSRQILDNSPSIVHFSGHGAGEDGLVFEDESGQVRLIGAQAIAGLFKLFADSVECVVLNACYSQDQAEKIARYIPYVVGMRNAIGDRAAIEFAIAFYDALGAGRGYEFAYELACNRIDLAGIAESDTPKLLKKEEINPPIAIQDRVGETDSKSQPECPYQGLEPFTKDKARFFFGRDSEVESVKNKLKKHTLILVVGNSGVGKSSFTQAGLVPSLEKEGWKSLTIKKPGIDPINRLLIILEDFFGDYGRADEFGRWRENFISIIDHSEIDNLENLARIVNRLPGTQELLLVVDQFEEIFTICTDQANQNKFLNLLCQLANVSSRLSIVVNMRADFESLLNNYPAISRLLNNEIIGIQFLQDLKNSNLVEAITKPAEKQGYTFENILLAKILQNFGEENCLPLLQFTLKRLWEYGVQNTQNNQLLEKHYNEIGGLKESLNRQADEIYKKLETELQQEMAKRLFLNLVQTNKHTKDTRIRQKKEDILNIGRSLEKKQAMTYVLNCFVNKRLLVIDREGWVDLAHEILMEGWQRFKDWREKDRDLRLLIVQMEEYLQEWKKNEKSDIFLLPPSLIMKVNAITFIEEQIDELEKEFQLKPDLKHFYDTSVVNHKLLQLSQVPILERDAREAQEKLDSSEPLFGSLQTLQLVSKCLKSRLPGSDLPGTVQNALRLAMEIYREQKCFLGHRDKVNCVAISHDGKWFVSGGEDKTLRLWNLEGNCCAVFEGHEASIWSVAFSPDNTWFVSGSADNTLRRWKLDVEAIERQSIVKGEQIGKPFVGHKDWIRSVIISPDGEMIVSGSKDRTWCLWDLDGNLISQSHKEHTDWIFSIAIWQDPKDSEKSFIVSGSVDGTIRRWNLNGESIGEVFKGHKGWVRSVTVTNNGKWLISGSEDTTIRLWNLDEDRIKILKGHDNRVLSVKVWQDPLSTDGEALGFIASSSADYTIQLWNFNGDSIGQPLKGHTDWVRDIKISTDGKFIVSGSRDETVRLWNLEGNLIGQSFGKRNGRILSVAFSSNGNLIVSGGEDRSIYLWNSDGTFIKEIGKHEDWVRSVRFTSDDKYIVSGSADKTLRLWKLDGTLVETHEDGHKSWIRSISVSPDGNHIVSSSNDKTLCLWEIKKLHSDISDSSPMSLRQIKCFTQKHYREVLCVAFSLDSEFIVSGSADKTIRLWGLDGKMKTNETAFGGHKDRVMSVAFSPDSRYIVSVSDDRTICLWDVEGEKIWQKKLEHQVRAVAFSPIKEFPLIVSGSRDGTLQLWDVEGYKIGNPLKGHQDAVRSVKFSPDGKFIVSASEDGTLRLWEAGNWKDWLKVCCKRIFNHPILQESTDIAKEVLEICNKSLEERI